MREENVHKIRKLKFDRKTKKLLYSKYQIFGFACGSQGCTRIVEDHWVEKPIPEVEVPHNISGCEELVIEWVVIKNSKVI